MRKQILWLVLILTVNLHAYADPQAVPVDQEPCHHQVLDNEYIRMFDVIVAPKEATLLHRHDRDYFFIILGDSNISNERLNEKPVAMELKDNEIRFAKGGFSHVARNLADTAFHNLTIELKNPGEPVCGVPSVADCKSSEPSGMVRTVIQTAHTVIQVTTLQPQEETSKHTHAHPHLAIALDDFTMENRIEGKPARTFSMKKGEWTWVSEGGITHTLKNTGAKTARILSLEIQ